MNIAFVWTGVTSYMADCWRKLSSRTDVALSVTVIRHQSGSDFDADSVLRGLNCRLVDDGESLVAPLAQFRPDVIFAVGWHSKSVRELVCSRNFALVPKVCCFDMPWRFQLRCILAKFVLSRFLRHYDCAYVPGASAERYAKWLGFGDIVRGLFSIDTARHSAAPVSPRRGFLYIGRFSPEKRLDLLLAGYRRYRAAGGDWPLDLYGSGRLPCATDIPGVRVHGFVPPAEVSALYASCAALVMTSAFDPWPLVILEATSCGAAVIASDRCGNARELGARTVAFGDVGALANALGDCAAGKLAPASRELVANFDVGAWSERTFAIAERLCRCNRG